VRSLPLWALLSLMRSLPSLALSLVRSLPSWELSLMRSLPSWALLSLMRSLPSLALLSLVSRPVPWDLMCEGEMHLLHLVSLTQLNGLVSLRKQHYLFARGTPDSCVFFVPTGIELLSGILSLVCCLTYRACL